MTTATASPHQDTARNIIRLREQAAEARAQAADRQARTAAAEQQGKQLTDQLAKQSADQDSELNELNETARELKNIPTCRRPTRRSKPSSRTSDSTTPTGRSRSASRNWPPKPPTIRT